MARSGLGTKYFVLGTDLRALPSDHFGPIRMPPSMRMLSPFM